MAKKSDAEVQPVAEDVWVSPTEHEPGMPKVDADGRKIVKLVADNEEGFRYAHEDQMRPGDAIFGEEPVVPPEEAKGASWS